MPTGKTYSIYTRCDHCGVYDRDPAWCALCGRKKEILHKQAPAAQGPGRPQAAGGSPPRPGPEFSVAAR